MKGIKTGGRQKGTANVLTSDLRGILKSFVQSEMESLPEKFKELESEKRIELLIKLLPYVLPKCEAVTYNVGEPIITDWTVN